jgi:hypothetical protein
MEDLFTLAKKKYFLESSQTAVVEYEIVDDVHGKARIDIISTVRAGRQIAARWVGSNNGRGCRWQRRL